MSQEDRKRAKQAQREAMQPNFRPAVAGEEIADTLEEIRAQIAMTNVHLANISNALSRIASKP